MKKNLFLLMLAATFIFTACQQKGNTGGGSAAAVNIVYINTDTLQVYDNYFKHLNQEISLKVKEAENRMLAKGQKFQAKINKFQNKVKSGLLSANQQQSQQNSLGIEQQNLQQEQATIAQGLEILRSEVNEIYFKRVNETLDKIRVEKGYQMIISFNNLTDMVRSTDPALDITQDVLKVLNSEYEQNAEELNKKALGDKED